MPRKLLMGNEAFAYAALIAGVRVVAGYPGTPSSELVETVARLHASGYARGVHVEWSTNEKAALELLAGASYAGARTLFTCKQVGLNVASDPLLSLNYIGPKGAVVLFVADDPGPISSQTEQDTRRFARFAKVPVLDPSTPDEGFAMMKEAFDISERYSTPVIVRPTTRIDHASTFFDVPDFTQALPISEEGFVRDSKWVIFPRRAYEGHGEVNERLPRISEEFSRGSHNPIERCGDNAVSTAGKAPKKGIVCGGVSAAYAREAADMLSAACKEAGVPVPAYKFMQVGTPYPFPQKRALEFARGLSDILVFEELDHVLEDDFMQLAGRVHAGFDVHGKLDGWTLDRGENSTDDCLVRMARFLGVECVKGTGRLTRDGDNTAKSDSAAADDAATEVAPAPKPAVRPPVLCAGCPHRGSFYAVKQALGKTPAVLSGDIGCYTLGNAQPLDAVDTCLCMGAGITMSQGFSIVEPQKKCVAFVGDSTFFASGLTGIANAVYNQHDITIAVLDNSTTAMTGSQPHPGTGQTLMGPKSKPIDIEGVLRALGVECIEHANPFDLGQSTSAARAAIEHVGPSAIIFKGPCIQLTRPAAPALIDADSCTACRKCIKSIGCPAIGMNADGTAAIVDESLCWGCGLCQDVCPFDVISVPARQMAPAGEDAAAKPATVDAHREVSSPAGEDAANTEGGTQC